MAINVTGKSNFTPAPAGSHIGRCFRVIDLGTQENSYQGQDTSARKILIQFELPNEVTVFHQEKGQEPFTVQKEFTASLGKKANLRSFLESWRNRLFTEEEITKFDVSVLAGQPCMINVIHKTSAAGNIRAEIQSVMKLPKGMDCPPAFNPATTLSLEEGEYDEAVHDGLPEWIRTKIAQSPEYKSIIGDKPVENAGQSYHEGESLDDIPF